MTTPEKQAELLKDQGNMYFKKDRLAAAIEAYTEVSPPSCSNALHVLTLSIMTKQRIIPSIGACHSHLMKLVTIFSCKSITIIQRVP